MDRVRALLPSYSKASRIVGIPLFSIPALHYREAEFARKVRREGGPFQLDLGGSGPEHHRRIARFVKKVGDDLGIVLGDIESDFDSAVIVAAWILSKKARQSMYKADGSVNEDVLADAFWGYNGRSKYHTQDGKPSKTRRHWKFSPYVSNDPRRGIKLRIRGTIPDGKCGRLRIDRADPRPGAMVIYRELASRRSELV